MNVSLKEWSSPALDPKGRRKAPVLSTRLVLVASCPLLARTASVPRHSGQRQLRRLQQLQQHHQHHCCWHHLLDLISFGYRCRTATAPGCMASMLDMTRARWQRATPIWRECQKQKHRLLSAGCRQSGSCLEFKSLNAYALLPTGTKQYQVNSLSSWLMSTYGFDAGTTSHQN